jgi:hypothetical protein
MYYFSSVNRSISEYGNTTVRLKHALQIPKYKQIGLALESAHKHFALSSFSGAPTH